jgi:uncharacterized membrane protein YheB (UPF0754 family)
MSSEEKIRDAERPRNNHLEKLSDLLSAHLEYGGKNQEAALKKSQVLKKPDKIKKLHILKILKPIPWLLLAIFIFTFLWDFNGYNAVVFGLQLQFEGILRIISVSGMIGFLTNWIAITMLFRPLKKRPLLGQGLIPAHKERIAYRLARAVSDDLINPSLIQQKIHESKAVTRYRRLTLLHVRNMTSKQAFRDDLKTWILEYISSQIHDPVFRKKISAHILAELEEALHDKILEKAALKTYSFFRGQTLIEFIEDLLTKIPVTAERSIDFIDEYLDELPGRIEKNSEKIDELITQGVYMLVNQLNVQKLVEENLKTFDEQKLENMIRNATNEQLKTIQYLGAVLGTIGGFVIWEPVLSLVILSVVFGSVFLTDKWLYK